MGVLLAAGAGSRFGGDVHKLEAIIDGVPVVARSCRAMCTAGLDEVLVVQGAVDLCLFLPEVPVLFNPDWETGQRSSLLVALEEARRRGVDAVVVGLADQPFVPASAWRAVADCPSPVAVAVYGGQRGNPVRLAASTWAPLAAEEGPADEGARSFIAHHPELVAEVACEGNPADIDTPEDLGPWT
jgi:CTP:molybdopterin cytidylyltransferase MocA